MRVSISLLEMNESITDEAWQQAKLMHIVQSIVPNVLKMYDDLKSNVPQITVREKLEVWTTKWKEDTPSAKRARDTLAPSTIPKRVKAA